MKTSVIFCGGTGNTKVMANAAELGKKPADV